MEKTGVTTCRFCRNKSGQNVIIYFMIAILFFPYEPLSMSLNDAVLKLFMERNYIPVIKLTSMKLRFALKNNTGCYWEYWQPQTIRATTRVAPTDAKMICNSGNPPRTKMSLRCCLNYIDSYLHELCSLSGFKIRMYAIHLYNPLTHRFILNIKKELVNFKNKANPV